MSTDSSASPEPDTVSYGNGVLFDGVHIFVIDSMRIRIAPE
ncbi:MAG: hypothetical protein ACO1OC_01520 [Tuberibacillus sp.]